jgi:hypothetical protein
MVIKDAFRTMRRACYGCNRTDVTLMPQND